MPPLALVHSPLTSAAAWGTLPSTLRAHGWDVLVPEVLDDDEPPFATHFVARAAQQLGADAPGEHLVLVGHSGAGPLLPQLGFARQSSGWPVAGYLFLDAMLPRTIKATTRMELMEVEDPVFAAELASQLSAGERFPDWTDRDLAELIPDVTERATLLAGLRPRSLAFFTEALPQPADWPDAPCGYLQLSSAYDQPARAAELRGWHVKRLQLHHFAAITHPMMVADALTNLLTEY